METTYDKIIMRRFKKSFPFLRKDFSIWEREKIIRGLMKKILDTEEREFFVKYSEENFSKKNKKYLEEIEVEFQSKDKVIEGLIDYVEYEKYPKFSGFINVEIEFNYKNENDKKSRENIKEILKDFKFE